MLSFSYGFARSWVFGHGPAGDNPKLDPVTLLGEPAYTALSGFRAIPSISVLGNYTPAFGNGSIGSQPWSIIREGQETHQLLASLSRVQGQHELKFGGEGRMHRINFVQPGTPAGLYNFDFNGTSQHPSSGGGDAMASFLPSVNPGSWGQYEIPAFVSTQSFQWAGFVNDNWRVNRKLTVNIGLRYDLSLPRTERYNRMNSLDTNVASPLQVPAFPNLKGAEVFVSSSNRYNYATEYADFGNFGPRLGIAYKLTDKTVIRTGYGIFSVVSRRGAAGTGGSGYQGYDTSTNWINSYQNDGATPWGRLSNPFPAGVRLPPGSSKGLLNDVGFGAAGPTKAYNQTPYEQTWSFGMQREIPWGVLIDANYVGKKGTHLYYGGAGELNYLPGAIEHYNSDQISGLQKFVPNPFYGVITDPTSSLSSPTVQAYQLQLRFPQFTSFGTDEPPWANSKYHAFQLRVEKRFSAGLQFLVTYTKSKSIDDASVTSGGTTWLGGSTSLQDPNNRSLERSLSQFDIPQVLQFSYVYELPVGKGKLMGKNLNPVLNTIIGGWKTNGIWRFDNGQPIIIGLQGGKSLPTYGGQRPNQSAAIKRNNGANWLNQYFANPEVFTVPAPYTLGTAPRVLPNIRLPGTANSNLSLFKEFPLSRIREGMRLEYRFEAFNALNHPQFCGPNTTVNTSTFGKISGQCNSPREVQMGLQLFW